MLDDAAWSVEQSVQQCFEHQAHLHADRIAIIDGTHVHTYAELDRDASMIAARIMAAGGAPRDRIVVGMQQGAAQIIAVLGTLKAGRMVVVLNPADPPSRLAMMLGDCEPSAIVTDSRNEALASQLNQNRRTIVRADELRDAHRVQRPSVASTPDDIAFLVYTSGSSGRPKGVMQSHRMVLHNAVRLSRGMGITSDDRLSLLASLAAGQGISTTWCALLNGAALCPFALADLGGAGLAMWLREHAITVLIASASVFRRLAQSFDVGRRFESVRLVRLASEPATMHDLIAVRRLFSDSCVVLNSLSSTETGNILQARIESAASVHDGRLTVGVPARDFEILLRGDDGQLGERVDCGEIVVRSRYLASGYWRDESLTHERFGAVDPDGARTFSSGDLARRSDDGTFMFLGRRDGRIKVRGHRVEPSEVEDILRRHPLVEHAAVLSRSDASGESQLTAFVSMRAGHRGSDESLRRSLRSSLPASMMPSGWKVLDQMPLTAGGKIDREQLRQMVTSAARSDDAHRHRVDPPDTATEIAIAAIWSKALGDIPIRRHDDFFDLGGDSLNAAIAISHIHTTLGIAVDMRTFAEAPVLKDLAKAIDRRRASADQLAPVRIPRDRPLPVSFAQQRIWRFSQSPESSAGYTMSFSHVMRGPLSIEIFRDCLQELIDRHESLRTTFAEIEGEPMQIVHPAASIEVPLHDLRSSNDSDAEAQRLFEREIHRPFDLAQLPLLRMTIARLRDDEYLLMRVNHHIISDRWSWNMFFSELAVLYGARLRNEPAPILPNLPLQMADYAAWQRQAHQASGAGLRSEIKWWQSRLGGKRPPKSLDLSCRRAQPANDARPDEGFMLWGLDARDSLRLDRVAREVGVSYFGARLAAFTALIAMTSGNHDFVLGTYLNQRHRAEFLGVFGFFSNLASLRLQFKPRHSFRKWMARVQRTVLEAQSHGDAPYELIGDGLRSAGVTPPALQIIFSTIEQSENIHLGDVEMNWLERRVRTMPWGFTLCFNRHQEQRHCYAGFDARIYDPAAVRSMIQRLQTFIRRAAENPDASCRSLMPA